MHHENKDLGKVDQFLCMFVFMGSCTHVSREGEVLFKEGQCARLQHSQFVKTNTGVEHILNSKETKEIPIEGILSNCVNLLVFAPLS